MFPNLKIELDPREDRYNNIIHIGRNQSPISLKFKKGVAFLIFLSEEGNEELHIACAKTGSQCDSIKKRIHADGTLDRYVVKLEHREDEKGRSFYIGIVQDDNLEIDFSDGYIFFVFSSKQGKEELHITKNKEQQVREKPEVEIYGEYKNKVQESMVDFQ
jgi:hypothetical protein